MTKNDIYAGFLEELVKVAPDLDPTMINDADHLQDDLELDSMDILNLVTALHQRFGVDIPENDYPQIATTAMATNYLAAALGITD